MPADRAVREVKYRKMWKDVDIHEQRDVIHTRRIVPVQT